MPEQLCDYFISQSTPSLSAWLYSLGPPVSRIAWTYFHVITAEKWTDGCEILVLQKYKIPSVLVFRSQPAHYFHNTDKNSEQVKYSCRHASMHNGWILLQHNDETMTASHGKSGLLVLTPLWKPVLKSKGLHKIPWLQAQVKPIARTCSEASMSALQHNLKLGHHFPVETIEDNGGITAVYLQARYLFTMRCCVRSHITSPSPLSASSSRMSRFPLPSLLNGWKKGIELF